MDLDSRIDSALRSALGCLEGQSPPKLLQAMHDAVFPGGGRLRPRLVHEVARACGAPHTGSADAAAAAIELLHCASLVHDDLPCFDDAATRRGRPSIHAAYGEPLAVLAGDGLIVHAFEALAGPEVDPRLRPGLLRVLARGVGAARGIIAGQAWESETRIDLRQYHQAKTGALFEAAVRSGAIAGGGDPDAWAPVGAALGEAYQVADDLLDALGREGQGGKPLSQDLRGERPNAVHSLGVRGALRRFEGLLGRLGDAVPDCPGRDRLRRVLLAGCTRLLPEDPRPMMTLNPPARAGGRAVLIDDGVALSV